MWVTLVTLCLVANVYGRPEIINPITELKEEAVELERPVHSELQALQDNFELEAQPEDLNRKKKHVTTFCVEIRPSDHKPFQVCEPAQEKGSYNQNSQVYYPPPTYGGVQPVKSQISLNSGGGTQSKPAYATPVKTYASSDGGAAPKQQPYNGYRESLPEVQNLIGPGRSAISENEEKPEAAYPAADTGAAKSTNEDEKINIATASRSAFNTEDDPNKNEQNSPARSAASSEPADKSENKAINDELSHANSKTNNLEDAAMKEDKKIEASEGDPNQMRAASYHDDAYPHNSGYGTPTHYIPVSPAHHGHPHHTSSHHSGLVITCQPNLAGYAHGVPSSFHHEAHHEQQPGYNYRSANGAYGRPYPYRPVAQYGGYKQYHPRPIYRPQAQVYKGPVYSHPVKPQAYAPSPVVKPFEYVPKPVEYIPKPLEYVPQSSYPAKPQEYIPAAPHPFKPQEFGSPAPIIPVKSLDDFPVSPSHRPIEYEPTEYLQPGPSPAYQPPAEYYPPAPVSPKPLYPQPTYYKPPAYALAPETYARSSEVMDKVNNKDDMAMPMDDIDKEKHTLKKMEEISNQRVQQSWLPEGMEEVFSPGNAREADEAAAANDAKEGGYGSADLNLEKNNGAKEAELHAEEGPWRNAEEGPWRNAEEGGWRNAEEGGWRNAVEDQNLEEPVAQPNGNWRNNEEENSKGMFENKSRENKIEDN